MCQILVGHDLPSHTICVFKNVRITASVLPPIIFSVLYVNLNAALGSLLDEFLYFRFRLFLDFGFGVPLRDVVSVVLALVILPASSCQCFGNVKMKPN